MALQPISPINVLQEANPQLKPKHKEPLSAKNGWGVKSPSEKKWIERHIRADIGQVSAERTEALEKQIRTLMHVRQEKIDLGLKIGKLRKRNQELNNRLVAAELKVSRLTEDNERLKQERNRYALQSSRFNNLRKESGLPTLPPASLSE